MKINDLVKQAHANTKDKGWHDRVYQPLEIHALITTEVAEATEAVRRGLPDFYFVGNKPEGEAVELADVVLRIADYFGLKNWNLEDVLKVKMEYNATRPYKHGKKL